MLLFLSNLNQITFLIFETKSSPLLQFIRTLMYKIKIEFELRFGRDVARGLLAWTQASEGDDLVNLGRGGSR